MPNLNQPFVECAGLEPVHVPCQIRSKAGGTAVYESI